MGTPNHADDWDDLATNGAAGKVGKIKSAITSATGQIVKDWVGSGDTIDYNEFTINSAAKLCLSVNAPVEPVKVSIYSLQSKTDKKGKTTYSLKSLVSVSTVYDKDAEEYMIDTKPVLLDKGKYYFSVQTTGAKTTSADYTVYFNKGNSVFYTKGVNTDDWNDLATKGAAGKVAKIATAITAGTGKFIDDWVGYGDEVDYKEFTINSAAKLSLLVQSLDAVKATICSLQSKTDRSGKVTYSLKPLQTVTPKYDKNLGKYIADGKGLLLDKGKYYIGVQSTNAAKGGNAAYTVMLNQGASVFYTKGVNTDDWDDLATKGATGKVAKIATPVTKSSGVIVNDWVGYGDAVDYKEFTLNTAAKLSLTIQAPLSGAVNMTIYSLQSKTDKNGKTTYSLKKVQSVTPKYDKTLGQYIGSTKSMLLEKGKYYIGIQSTDAARGGSTDYQVSVKHGESEFFTKGSAGDNNWEAAPALAGSLLDDELRGSFSGWVGFGDAVDYRTFTTNAGNGNGGYYYFDLALTDNPVNNLNLTLYEIVDTKGVKSLKKMKGATATSKSNEVIFNTMLKPNTKYVVGVEAPGAKQGKGGDYTVEVFQDQFAHFNMANNDKSHATVIKTSSADIFNSITKAAGGDSVDWYDVSALAGSNYYDLYLTNTWDKLAVKLTFYNKDLKETKVWVENLLSGKWTETSSLSVNNSYGVDCYFGDASDVKFLKVEAMNSARNSYALAVVW